MQSIFTSLSPNTEKDDIQLTFKLIFQPWKWRLEGEGPLVILNKVKNLMGFFGLRPQNDKRSSSQNGKKNNVYALEQEFKKYLGVKHAFAFNSGRSGFLAILNALGMEQASEILVQGFTCNALVNPIIWSNLKPVFVDINEQTLNIDSQDLQRKITSKSRGVIVQHTFGLPASLKEITEICEKHNLILIEDCAHSLGATDNGQKTGSFGRASFFSFGRDKIISSVYGGMAVTNDPSLAEKLRQAQGKFGYPSYYWIFQQLLHPILCNFLIIPLYGFFGLGRWVLGGFQKLKILSKAVHKKEKQGKQPNYIPKKMPNALAILALHQFKKLDRFIKHQKQIVDFYDKKGTRSDLVLLPLKKDNRVYMRYPILIKNRDTDKILRKARKQKIFLNDGWRKATIVPVDTNQEKMGYISGSCPVAEKVAKNILNLPTHINISKKKARRIVDFLKKIL